MFVDNYLGTRIPFRSLENCISINGLKPSTMTSLGKINPGEGLGSANRFWLKGLLIKGFRNVEMHYKIERDKLLIF